MRDGRRKSRQSRVYENAHTHHVKVEARIAGKETTTRGRTTRKHPAHTRPHHPPSKGFFLKKRRKRRAPPTEKKRKKVFALSPLSHLCRSRGCVLQLLVLDAGIVSLALVTLSALHLTGTLSFHEQRFGQAALQPRVTDAPNRPLIVAVCGGVKKEKKRKKCTLFPLFLFYSVGNESGDRHALWKEGCTTTPPDDVILRALLLFRACLLALFLVPNHKKHNEGERVCLVVVGGCGLEKFFLKEE